MELLNFYRDPRHLVAESHFPRPELQLLRLLLQEELHYYNNYCEANYSYNELLNNCEAERSTRLHASPTRLLRAPALAYRVVCCSLYTLYTLYSLFFPSISGLSPPSSPQVCLYPLFTFPSNPLQTQSKHTFFTQLHLQISHLEISFTL